MSESLRPSLAKRLSYELVKVSPMILFGSKVVDQNQGKQKIDQVVKRTAATLLINFGALLKNLLSADEAFKVLIAANEPFKRTRRRLPPQAEKELADWLVANRSHPYPTDEFIDKFCAKFEGIEEDQPLEATSAFYQMTESTFNPSELISIIASTEFYSSAPIYQNVGKYCGVDWAGRCIQVPAEEFSDSLNPEQVKSLRTFQDNMLHFFEHFDAVMLSTISKEIGGFNANESIFIRRLVRDLEGKGLAIFTKMVHNFIDQFGQARGSPPSNNAQIREFQSFNSVIVDNLCDGDLGKTLKLVPSRGLARQLGVSDQKLRREIYLARQRALKKRPLPKKPVEGPSDDFMINYNELSIPTCASPLSSASSESASSEFEFELDNSQFQFIESPLEGWQSWLNVDMIEL